MPINIYRYLKVQVDIWRLPQISEDPGRYLKMPADIRRYPQIPGDGCKYKRKASLGSPHTCKLGVVERIILGHRKRRKSPPTLPKYRGAYTRCMVLYLVI